MLSSISSPSRHTHHRHRKVALFSLVWLVSIAFFGLACSDEHIDLDPDWPGLRDTPCQVATTEFQWFASTAPTSGVLAGDLGPKWAFTRLWLVTPPGWASPQASVYTNQLGQFGFFLQAQGTNNAPALTVYHPALFCRTITPAVPAQTTSLTTIKEPPKDPSCKVLEPLDLNLKTVDPLNSLEVKVISTHPHLAEIVKMEIPPKGDEIKLQIHCKTAGTLALLFAGQSLQATSFPLVVKPK